MASKTVSLEIYTSEDVDGKMYNAYMAGDGDSGITVSVETPEDLAEMLSSYIMDLCDEVDDLGEPDSWISSGVDRALCIAEERGYIARNSSLEEVKENIYEVLELEFSPDDIENILEMDSPLLDKVITEWLN